MGLGDEIMALGRAESRFEATGRTVAIVNDLNQPRDHESWHGNPAWNALGPERIMDGSGCRPYILRWETWNGKPQAIFNPEYRPRAGRVAIPDKPWICGHEKYVVIAPHIKKTASPNKNWGAGNWEKVIENFPYPVFQLMPDCRSMAIQGATAVNTPHFKDALRIIKGAALVLCNEGGPHHMAASMGRRAVVIFGSFISPRVTGYDFHDNIAVETEHGFCGRWASCEHCQNALRQITPAMIRMKALEALESGDVQAIRRI